MTRQGSLVRLANPRTRILNGSAALFVAHGFENTSVEQILVATSVARSSFYRFFANREEVLASIIRPVFITGQSHLDRITARNARGVLHGIFATYLDLWASGPDALRLSTRTGGVHFELFRDLHMPFREKITALLRLIESEGSLLNASAELTARLIARTAVPVLEVYHRDPRFESLFRATMGGLLLRPQVAPGPWP
ncbi:MAG: TetR/AcrR family transcriptional regulator [Gammaproteobacteria bacterium]